MSTILEALRKLQQDGERAHKNKTYESRSPDSSQPAPHSAGASGQGDEPPADHGEEPADAGSLPDDGSRGGADLPELIDKIERMLGKNRERPQVPGSAADISAKVTPPNEVVAPPEVTEPVAQAQQRATATPASTEPESEEDLQRSDSRARGLRQDWLGLLDREPDPAISEPTSESDEAEAQFTPIEDPETLEAFMKLPAADVTAASPDTSLRPTQAAPAMGGNWRDHQAEPFSGAAAPYPSDAPSTAGGHTLGTTEARLLESFEGASGASEDEEPSIYIDAGDAGVVLPSRLRTIATATAALAVGLFAGFLVVKAMIGGSDGADDQIATLPSLEQRAAVRAAAEVKSAATTMDADAGAGSGGAKGVARAKEKKKQGKGKKAQVKPLAKKAKARPVVKAADSVAPLRAAAAPTDQGPTPASRPATAKPAPPAKPGVAVASATPVAVASAKPIPPPVPGPALLPDPEPQVSLTIPPGAPHVDLVFVQWARQSTKRLVSLRNLKGTLLVLREGDYADAAQGMKVSSIGREWVDFEWQSNRFRILMNDF